MDLRYRSAPLRDRPVHSDGLSIPNSIGILCTLRRGKFHIFDSMLINFLSCAILILVATRYTSCSRSNRDTFGLHASLPVVCFDAEIEGSLEVTWLVSFFTLTHYFLHILLTGGVYFALRNQAAGQSTYLSLEVNLTPFLQLVLHCVYSH